MRERGGEGKTYLPSLQSRLQLGEARAKLDYWSHGEWGRADGGLSILVARLSLTLRAYSLWVWLRWETARTQGRL